MSHWSKTNQNIIRTVKFKEIGTLCNIMPIYAVHRGRMPGIYYSWEECKAQVNGFPKCKFRGFKNLADATYFVKHGTFQEQPTLKF